MTAETSMTGEEAAGAVMSGSAMQAHIAGIYRMIYAKVGNRTAAEELTSRVFLKASPRLLELREDKHLHAALTTMARAAIAEYWRGQGSGQGAPRDEAVDLLWCGDADDAGASTRSRAHRILESLPEQERTIVRMRLLQGCSAAEIGSRLGIEPRLVQAIQLRALRRAATLLAAP
jgi:RNA polymerase sigma-70 factor (ECF subfamily)